MTLRALLLPAVLMAVLALGACGGSSSSTATSTSAPATTSTATSGTSTNIAQAQQKCLTQASQITDATAKSVATSACKQINSSNTNITDALKKAQTACLDAVAKLPSVLQGPAKDQCAKISG